MTDRQQHRQAKTARQARRKAQVNCDRARQKLLQQRVELARRRAQNREQSESRRDGETGTNPTAHSTLPSQNSNAVNAARNSHSTVPATPKYSEASNRERLYGRRLHARATRHGDTEGDR